MHWAAAQQHAQSTGQQHTQGAGPCQLQAQTCSIRRSCPMTAGWSQEAQEEDLHQAQEAEAQAQEDQAARAEVLQGVQS